MEVYIILRYRTNRLHAVSHCDNAAAYQPGSAELAPVQFTCRRTQGLSPSLSCICELAYWTDGGIHRLCGRLLS